MLLRTGVYASGVLLFAFAIAACGSDDSSNSTAAGNTTATSAVTSATAAAVPAPSAQELQATLDLVSSPDKPVSDKAAVVVEGTKRTPNLGQLTAALAGYKLTYVVHDIAVTGSTATAKVDVTSPHGAMPMPMTWQYVGNSWKLSDSSTCVLLELGKARCAP